jgi:hypothetical protein
MKKVKKTQAYSTVLSWMVKEVFDRQKEHILSMTADEQVSYLHGQGYSLKDIEKQAIEHMELMEHFERTKSKQV